jgi:hypothetical protein
MQLLERIRQRWEEIPPSLRPLVGISVGIGALGLLLSLAGLILLLRNASSTAPARPPATVGPPVGPVPVRIQVKNIAFPLTSCVGGSLRRKRCRIWLSATEASVANHL